MYVGTNFIWLHPGKTGGDKTSTYFEILKNRGFKLRGHSRSVRRKHYSIDGNQKQLHELIQSKFISNEDIENKLIITNIRRPISLLLSYHFHITKYQCSKPIDIDRCINYIQHIHTRFYSISDRFIRQEFLTKDFLNIFTSMMGLRSVDIQAIKRLEDCRINYGKYNKDIHRHLTKTQINKIYDSDDRFEGYEKKLYGNTIRDTI